MNKLILIGNGFDLAHGLPTSYSHFINDFWKNIHLNYTKDEYKKLIHIDEQNSDFFSYNKVENFNDFYSKLQNYCMENGHQINRSDQYLVTLKGKPNYYIFKFKSSLFKIITTRNSIQNWVDIENMYYLELKKIVKYTSIDNEQKLKLTQKLNNEFNTIRTLLLSYISEKVLNVYDVEKHESPREFLKMYNLFKPNSIKNNNPWNTQEFSFKEDEEHIENSEITESEVYILNFNYTDASFIYFIKNYESFNTQYISNSIHGEINAKGFKPVFGFGDEIDKDYNLIENLNKNEYLKYFKSFQYFQNKCYDSLLKFIDREKFQVSIMGHSCGLSDRVLLNTIFEHENCRSIKVFYHQKDDRNDNYNDLVYNISRHFKDKAAMRRKIVAKEFSSPLPQNVRFKKKTKES